ncbi:MAG: hypothetical protein HOJ67_04195 [Rhodospirillaceae bacterium]|jgi:hypothetical protein|nr:hypothetical protein [Rhodospirillales bacterium]MBT3906847.1 hypothetical protein [Rhodospirillaceae bacterium]MBT6220378.1 hypothetical protein [Rhodospirillaceae bacterium]MBT6361375.1 hypothetical protein [Rhodospirillaceae bacterium]
MTNLALKPRAFETVLFIDGISRSGKKLTCRILSNMNNVDYFLYRSVFEKICYLNKIGAVSESVATSLFQLVVEEAIYYRAIGRDLNARPSDQTSILNAVDKEIYLNRSLLGDGMEAVDRFNKAGRIAAIHVHHVMPTAPILFMAYPQLTLVHVMRHPIDLAVEWLRRGWGSRMGTDPLAFALMVDVESKPVPWFAQDWADQFIGMSEAERCIESVLWLQEANEQGYQRLSEDQKSRVYRFPFEHLVTQTSRIITDFSQLLSTQPHESMPELLGEEQCPRTLSIEDQRVGLRVLESNASEEVIAHLKAASIAYENYWNMEQLVT